MFESIFRIVVACGLAFVGVRSQALPLDWAWKASLLYGTWTLLSMLLERRGLRNPTFSTATAVVEIGLIAFLLARMGLMPAYAFTLLIPSAVAVARHRAFASTLAPVAGAIVFSSASFAARPAPWTETATLSVLIAALVFVATPKVITEKVIQAVETPALPNPESTDTDIARSYLELRENFRRLRDHYQTLERRTRRDRISCQMSEASLGTGASLQQRVTDKLRELTNIDGVALFACAEYSETLVVKATSGTTLDAAKTTAIPIAGSINETSLRHQFDLWMKSLRSASDNRFSRTIVLKDRNRVVGVVTLTDSSPDHLQKAYEIAEEAAPIMGQMLQAESDSEILRKRLKEAELLYSIANIGLGATTAVSLAGRVVRELWGAVDLDHLSIQFLDGTDLMPVATEGASAALFPHLQFAHGSGVEGWIAADAPEIFIFDTTSDDRVAKKDALQRRVGSYAVLPLRQGEAVIGMLAAACHRSGGIDLTEIETLRVVSAEVSQALARLEEMKGIEGLATPREFSEMVAQVENGCLVYLEPANKERILEDFGQAALDHALRTFARRMRPTLPAGSAICRRSEGDFVALLRDVAEPFARAWANQATATASLIGLKTADGRARIPLGLKARVSALQTAQQTHQIQHVSPFEAANT